MSGFTFGLIFIILTSYVKFDKCQIVKCQCQIVIVKLISTMVNYCGLPW